MNISQRLAVLVSVVGLCCSGCARTTDSPETPETSGLIVHPQNAPPEQSEPSLSSLQIEPDEFVPEAGFTRLTVEDFAPFEGGETTWREVDSVIVCSGDPKGYLYSNDTFSNYTWRAEYRFVPVEEESQRKLSNTGFMIHIQEPHKIWPRSLEVQGRWDEMASIKSNGGVPALTVTDEPAARESARRPVGEWNAVEIVSHDGALTATLNGQMICTSEAGELTEGRIGLQSELFEVHFRRLRIRRDD